MKNSRNATVLDCFIYGIVMMVSNLAGTLAMLFVMLLLKESVGQEAVSRNYAIFTIVFSTTAIAVAMILTRLYFKYKIPDIMPKQTDKYDTLKMIRSNYLFIVLPAEIIRMILSVLPIPPGKTFGYRFIDGFFAIAPNLTYDQFYMAPNHRLESIRESGYTLADNAIFFVVYLLYFIITIAVMYFVFSDVWKKYEESRKNDVRIRMDPEQMK